MSIQLSEADTAVIKSAAEQCGQSLADFVHSTALRSAAEVVSGRLIVMSPEGFSDFCSSLSARGAPVREIVELANRLAPWEPGYTAGK